MRRFFLVALVCVAVMLLIVPTGSYATTYNSHYAVVDGFAGGDVQKCADLDNLGAKWIRVPWGWIDFEIADNVYDWSLMDGFVDAMNARGVNIFFNFGYTPAWARSGGDHRTPPSNPAKYTEFITAMVTRYRDDIKYWGFWNEPNLTQFYNADFTGYVNNLLIPGIQAVKDADPNAKTVVGELSTYGDDVGKLRQILQAVTAAGKFNLVDVVCHHSYDGGNTASGRLADMDTLRNMIVTEGYGNKDFWCTETGWQSSQGGEANQANQIMGFYRGMDARPWWRKTFYYTMGEAPSLNGETFGLFRENHTLKPSGTQLQAYIAEMADNADVVSDTIPATMTAGQQYTVSVTMRNTGTANWTESGQYKLGGVGDSDPFANTRQNLNISETVNTDNTRTFTFVMTAPGTGGTYTTDWQMVHEGVHWFGHILTKQVTVNAGTNNASVVSNTIPSTMTAGQQYSVSVTMQNTGTTTWAYTVPNGYYLGAVGDSDPFAATRAYLNVGESIAPGQQRTFTFTMTAPTTTGTYTTDWQMLQDAVQWFGGTLTKQVTVNAPATNNAQVISDTIPTTMTAGQQYSVSVTMKNIGGTTWSADGYNGYKLGGAGDSDPFYTVNNPPRILMNAGETVAPNAQRTFTFTMTAPSTPGTYTTDWRMVREWIEWFGGTLSKQVTVNASGPVTISNSTFDSDANLWTISLWHSGAYSDGTMAWNSGAGRTGGGMRFIGSGATDNNDRCNREGAELQRTISTVGRSGIQVSYDLRVNSMGSTQTGAGAGTCGVDHNDIQEQLTVYYSTNGGTNWTEASNIMRSTLLGYTSYGTRTIDLSGVSACNNNANFRLRFRWQCNSTSDTVDLDNIKVTGN